ncbi:MAG: inositol monophosphatase family protein [Patescibacteria group bacterium]
MLDIAIKAAKEGGQIALSYFKHIPKVTYKPDSSPVTKADIEAEKAIRQIVLDKFPDHGFIGEELENTNPKAKYQWVVDPIDGTKSFVRGIKDWGTLLAVLEDGKPIIGIYNSPATNEIFTCQREKGTFLNGKKTHVSKVRDLQKSFIVHSSINHFIASNNVNNVVTIAKMSQGKRGASDCNGLNMVLKGQADVNISGHGSIWDYAAPAILVEEAGGKFTDFNGRFSLASDTGIFSNGLVHKQVLNILNK